MIYLKQGVRIHDLAIQMLLAANVVDSFMRSRGYRETTITSGCEGRPGDGVHKATSLHYSGRALDFRTRNLLDYEKYSLHQAVSEALGENFDVLLERTHLHVEYDPPSEVEP